MANDCLVTKLKGVVDNDNLSKFGKFRIVVEPGEFSVQVSNACTISWDNNVDTIKNGENTITSPIEVLVGATLKGTLTRKTTFEFTNKYGLQGITVLNSPEDDVVTVLDWNPKYTPNFTALSVQRHPSFLKNVQVADIAAANLNSIVLKDGSVTNPFNISAFADNTSLITIQFMREPNVSGNIASLGKLVNANFGFSGSANISGNVEELVESLCANDKHLATATTCVIDAPRSGCKFHDASISVTLKCTFSSDGCVITNNSTQAELATYTKSTGTWSYNS